MRTALLIVGLALVACGKDDDEDVTYRVDGVPIVLERGDGPEEPEMVLAAELFRREAEPRWQLDTAAERALWASMTEIRWTDDSVPDGGTYQAGKLLIEWTGCAVDGPLYRLLTEHYIGDVTDDEMAWADDLAERNGFICSR